VDVFGLAVASGGAFLRDAALAAGHELDVFEALARGGPASLDELAGAIGVVAGRRRLGALLDVLAALGAITRQPSDAGGSRRFAAAATAPLHPVVARAGWGLLADVIRDDRALPALGDSCAVDDLGASGVASIEAERRFHHHLAIAGAAAAGELAAHLGTTSLLDLGAGVGAYSKAFLRAQPSGRATFVDTPSVLGLAAAWLGPLAARVSLVEGDASVVAAGDGYGAVLLANVLHLHPPEMCARLVAAAARAAAPGGVVVIKDLRIDEDRVGPLEGLLFALNMAIYTDAGDVYPTSQLGAWLADAGLVEIAEYRLVAAPNAVVMIARRPQASAESDAVGEHLEASAESDAVGEHLEASAESDTVGEHLEASAESDTVGERLEASGESDAVGERLEASAESDAVGEHLEASGESDAVGERLEASAESDALGERLDAFGESDGVGEHVDASAKAHASTPHAERADGAAKPGVAGARMANEDAARASAPAVDGHEAVAAELDAALARTAAEAWQALVTSEAIRPDAAAAPPVLAFPAALRKFLAAAIALERTEAGPEAAARADNLVRHYTEAMPRMRVAQLAGTHEPGATLFHVQLDWARLPRLGKAIDRLFEVLAEAGVAAVGALGAASAGAFRARTPTLAALYARTHYGGFMPLLYGFPADLAYMHARGVAEGLDAVATIDRYLTAPIVHELCHFAPDREAITPPHLDECIAGWLGVHVHPELAYPSGDHDDALYAAPWLAQVGQAIARAFGVVNLVRAHAGGDLAALPHAFVTAAAQLGRDDWRARRTLHFLSDTFDPAPWVALALAIGAGRSWAGETVPESVHSDALRTSDRNLVRLPPVGSEAACPVTLAALAAIPLATLELPADPAFDRAIVEDGLRAMCLASSQIAGSFRTRARLPTEPILIDAVACAIVAPRRGELDPVVPRFWLPPAVAARIAAQHGTGYTLRLRSIVAIPEAAAAICEASPAIECDGFALA
jgi:hypothetical protein